MSGLLTICGLLKIGGLAGNKGSTFFAKQGGIQTSEGCIPTTEGVILTRANKTWVFFTRTNTLQHENARQSALFAPKTPCFWQQIRFLLLPNRYTHPQGAVLCIWIMGLGSKIQRGGWIYREKRRQDACGTRGNVIRFVSLHHRAGRDILRQPIRSTPCQQHD
jgi:hypothetical protein